MNPQDVRIVAIDDDPDFAAVLRLCAEHVATPAVSLTYPETPDKGLATIEEASPDLVLLDYQLGDGVTGLDVLKAIREGGNEQPVVFLTGSGDTTIAVEAMKAGATDYLEKSELNPESLRRAIIGAMRHEQARRDLVESQEALSRSRDDLLSVLQKLGQGAALTDEFGNITFLNAAAERMLDVAFSDVEERHWERLWDISRDTRDALKAMADRPESDRVRVHVDVRLEGRRERRIEVDFR